MVTSQKKAPNSSSSENELSPDQTLGLVSLSLMQKLSQKDPSFSWLVDTKPDQINLKKLRDRLELIELAINTGAPLTTSEVSILMGAIREVFDPMNTLSEIFVLFLLIPS